jgi:hypothetical protein
MSYLEQSQTIHNEVRYVLAILRLSLYIFIELHTLLLVRFLSRTFLDCEYDLLGEMRATTSPSKLKTNLRNATQT